MKINPIDLRSLDEHASNVYEAIMAASKRARQINTENKIEFNALLSTIPQTQSEDENEDLDNPAQLKISLDFEKKLKPHQQALSELLDGKVEFELRKI
jgi:DNA-directed RNA polymerase subunit K/omega